MPNILLTTTCNRRCPYCFAVDAMAEFEKQKIDFNDLVGYADMIVSSGRLYTGVLGGEPTLHPEFADMVLYLVARGIQVNVFTNGICSDKLMDEIAQRFPGRSNVQFTVNVNFPEIETAENQRRQDLFIRRFASQVDLGVNIFRPDLDPIMLRDVAERTGLKDSRFRIGLAEPIIGEKNAFLGIDAYKTVAEKLVHLAEAVFPRGIKISFDCGFPLCSFTDEQLGRLRRCTADTKFVCSCATDLAPGRKAWSCFPMAKFSLVQLEPHADLHELERQFLDRIKQLRSQRQPGVFEACADCAYRRHGACQGGCIAHVASAPVPTGVAGN